MTPVPVVNSMNLSLRRGEILTLLGPSGCGKTTTLRMAIGLEKASAGRITFAGRVVDAPAQKIFVPAEKRNMGMVFQSYAIWPHMSVRENVGYPLKIRGHDPAWIKAEVERTLTLVGLDTIAERPGTRLSGGQQQRVAVARGLVYGPDLLLMDEPFSNLDVKLREQMRVEVKLLQRRLGIAVLFVTHDQSEALALSDRVALMHAGNIVQIDSPRELYRSPTAKVVRDFIGRTVLLEGKILSREAGGIMVELDAGARAVCQDSPGSAQLGVGARCEVSVRPEQLQVESAGDAAPTAVNQVQGRIMTLLFVGERYEAEVVLASEAVVSIYLPPTRVWEEGQRINLLLPACALKIWPVGA
jgi:ABC-type Fe3+/spermidine/putrescine transport system ATPase subunit